MPPAVQTEPVVFLVEPLERAVFPAEPQEPVVFLVERLERAVFPAEPPVPVSPPGEQRELALGELPDERVLQAALQDERQEQAEQREPESVRRAAPPVGTVAPHVGRRSASRRRCLSRTLVPRGGCRRRSSLAGTRRGCRLAGPCSSGGRRTGAVIWCWLAHVGRRAMSCRSGLPRLSSRSAGRLTRSYG